MCRSRSQHSSIKWQLRRRQAQRDNHMKARSIVLDKYLAGQRTVSEYQQAHQSAWLQPRTTQHFDLSNCDARYVLCRCSTWFELSCMRLFPTTLLFCCLSEALDALDLLCQGRVLFFSEIALLGNQPASALDHFMT